MILDDDTVCQYFDNVITESYVGFLKDGTIYYLKGGDDGASYSTNVGTLTTAFGSSNCTDDHNGFNCGLSTIFAGHNRDRVYAQDNECENYWYCGVSIYRYGESRCGFDSGLLS